MSWQQYLSAVTASFPLLAIDDLWICGNFLSGLTVAECIDSICEVLA